MNTLDERILIPADPRAVWELLSDLSKNASWQIDCSAMSPLTTNSKGQGARWRCSNDQSKGSVLEITTWYEAVGYEYRFVDGTPYQSNQGRIRLQEVAEGTIVQWTFTYQMGGLGGLVDSLSGGRSVQHTMVESLRKLYLLMKANNQLNFRESRALMQDAPDAESRAQYKPRHESAVQAEDSPARHAPRGNDAPLRQTNSVPAVTLPPLEQSPVGGPLSPVTAMSDSNETPAPPVNWPPALAAFPEPPIKEDDTRPRGRTGEFTAVPTMPTTPSNPNAEPEFISQIDDTAYRRPSGMPPPSFFTPTPEPIPAVPPDIATTEKPPEEATTKTDIAGMARMNPIPPYTPPPAEAAADTLPPAPDGDSRPTVDAPIAAQGATPAPDLPRLNEEFSGDTTDTSKVSVFDLFNIPRPSTTQAMRAVTLPNDAPAAAPSDTADAPSVSIATTGEAAAVNVATTDEAAVTLAPVPTVPLEVVQSPTAADMPIPPTAQAGVPRALIRRGWRVVMRVQRPRRP
jgi:hypothetical protein